MGAREHGQAGGPRDRCEECRGARLTDAVLDRELAERDPVEHLAVGVVVERDARLRAAATADALTGVRLVARQHVERPARSVVLRLPQVEVLRALEHRQHVLIAPAVVAEIRPGVVIAAMTPRVDHPVEGTRPAQHLAPRPVQLAARAGGLRHGAIAPVLLAVPQLEEPRRLVDRGIDIRPAGLDDDDAHARIDEPARDHRTSRSRADHDDLRDRWTPVVIRCHQ